MKNSPDKPFRMIGGNTEQAALHNRIAAIDRINYLVGNGFDLRKKSKEYRFLLDMEMYQRWYKNEPKDVVIDETFCQRSAEVLRTMEKDALEIEASLVGVTERVKKSFINHEMLPLKKGSEKCEQETYQTKKESFWKRAATLLQQKRSRKKEVKGKSTAI